MGHKQVSSLYVLFAKWLWLKCWCVELHWEMGRPIQLEKIISEICHQAFSSTVWFMPCRRTGRLLFIPSSRIIHVVKRLRGTWRSDYENSTWHRLCEESSHRNASKYRHPLQGDVRSLQLPLLISNEGWAEGFRWYAIRSLVSCLIRRKGSCRRCKSWSIPWKTLSSWTGYELCYIKACQALTLCK